MSTGTVDMKSERALRGNWGLGCVSPELLDLSRRPGLCHHFRTTQRGKRMPLEVPPHFLVLSQKLPDFWKMIFVYVSHKQMQTKPKSVPGLKETKVAQMGPQHPQGYLLSIQGEIRFI